MSMRAAILVLFAHSLYVQQSVSPQTPNPPQTATPPQAPTQEEDIELNAVMMESTFMIQGQNLQVPVLGTVFIVARPIPNSTPQVGRMVMVTAAHVLEQMQGDMAILQLRRKVDEKTNSWIRVPYPLQIRANGQPLWKKHPDADVAVMYISIPSATVVRNITPLMLADDSMLTEYDVKPGDELRCLGYPLGVVSNEAGFPVLRSGRIASYPLLPTDKTKTFLLDFRVFKGNSGGPVYFVERLRPIPTRLGGYQNFHFIMGLVSEETLFTEQSAGPYSQEIHQTQLGLAKVVHASLIKQAIEMLPAPTLPE
jgi:Trypsin-like peptidase domain